MDASEQWFETFFAQFPELGATWGDQQRNCRETDFIEKATGLSPPAKVLDVPCGWGRISLELSRRGYDVTGIDMMERYVAAASQAAKQEGLKITFRQGDMRELPAEAAFDAVVCWFGSFGYFDDEGNAAFARAACGALRPGRKLLIDTVTVETLLPKFRQRDFSRRDDGFLLQERSFDIRTGRINATWTHIRDREATSAEMSIRLYTVRELEQLLSAAGFAEVQLLETHTGKPFAFGSSRLTAVAAKAIDQTEGTSQEVAGA
jgi:cyclopropane fatty-acyl-phospholipid synthase-like methyltransferase